MHPDSQLYIFINNLQIESLIFWSSNIIYMSSTLYLRILNNHSIVFDILPGVFTFVGYVDNSFPEYNKKVFVGFLHISKFWKRSKGRLRARMTVTSYCKYDIREFWDSSCRCWRQQTKKGLWGYIIPNTSWGCSFLRTFHRQRVPFNSY